jgi:glycosyltransferase involved in cell wall biosynthesis
VIRDKVKLREFYCQCSIFILPSVAESFGLALAEAMACGCAGGAGKGVGFASTLTDAEEVLLMEESKSPLLYQSVKRLLDNEELRLKLSLAGCRRVQGLRWQQAIVDLAETYALWSSEYTKQ